MGAKTGIEWTDATWTPFRARNIATGKIGWHCEHVTEGCRNCYAERLNLRLGTQLPFKPGHRANIEIYVDPVMLTAPLRWRKPRRVFPWSMSDLFADFVPDDVIDQAFAVMAITPQHTYQALTKRPERAHQYITTPGRAEQIFAGAEAAFGRQWHDYRLAAAQPENWPLPNLWLGTSIHDQGSANSFVPPLLATPASKHFLSGEPLLGEVDLSMAWHGESALDSECWGECNWCRNGSMFPPLHNCQNGKQSEVAWRKGRSGLDWVIIGGESGPQARPMHPDWVRSLRDQCVEAGVSFFFKQWGEWLVGEPKDQKHEDNPCGLPLGYADGHEFDVVSDGHDIMLCSAQDESHGPSHIWRDFYGWQRHLIRRVGKKRAGRLLDGREWNELPEFQPAAQR